MRLMAIDLIHQSIPTSQALSMLQLIKTTLHLHTYYTLSSQLSQLQPHICGPFDTDQTCI